jgi:hypothetical protein
MKRPQAVLLALLVAQIALILVFRGPLAQSRETSESHALLPALASLTPSKVEIHGTEDKQVTLVREGEGWVVEEAQRYPADPERVSGLIDKLEAIKVQRPIARSGRYHSALKLTDREHERRVRVWDQPTGKPKVGLYMGTSPNYQITHVRRDGDDAVYEATGLASADVQTEAIGWIRSQLFDLDALTVTSVSVENAKGRFTVAKQDNGTWDVRQPPGRSDAIDASKVVELIRIVTLLTVTEPGGKLDEAKQGFQQPVATITLVSRPAADSLGTRAEETVLRVGGKVGEEAKRYVSRSGFEFAGIVYESSVQKLMEQTLAELR